MRIKSGVEQAVSILVILATQSEEQPVKSDIISARLNVSPSYLKKVMRKLVVNQLIASVSGNQGGFSLARPADQITMLDILDAIEGTDPFLQVDGLIQSVFPETELAVKGEELFTDVFLEAQMSYRKTLQTVTLEAILEQTIGTSDFRLVDWNKEMGKQDILALQSVNWRNEQ
ncbi:Rrf2 family transcriptional regulator [Sediminibacillus dalangtanensis]|uniref:Rrf2 family transcriptional regulator n=1 Tax=Sediminibacillus dalangtanensis TaxID=2729421 RepID=A0ABX7VN07_9BACI|nr:Rrf2 family transcriptional regulator [Sediminibacillus dalangtanensis]QTM97951.1 Rrf2 family transcriptional regulator [Sediminibacillus dalangtanensis]